MAGRSEGNLGSDQPISGSQLLWSGAVDEYPPKAVISRDPLFGSSAQTDIGLPCVATSANKIRTVRR